MKAYLFSNNRSNALFTCGMMSGLACALFLFEAVFLHNLSSLWLNWNLFLAWIPVFVVLLMERQTSKIQLLSLSFLWLLFFPNAPYIITDLVHLSPYEGNSYWHHQIMIYTYAFVSLICGLLSLYWIQKIWTRCFNPNWSIFFTISSILLSGYGVFLGRIERFNSWDFFTHPMALLKYVLHSFSNSTAILMTFEFSVFIGIAYTMLYSLIHLND